MRPRVVTALALLFVLPLAGCPKDPPDAPPAPPSPRIEAADPAPEPVPPLKFVAWTGSKSPAWEAIEKMQDEQKYAEALVAIEAERAKAQASGDSEGFVRAVIAAVQVQTALHGYETAVRALAELEWSDDLLGRTALHLYFAHSLVTYANQYAWEIRQREKVATEGPIDLKQWTWSQIHDHAQAQYLAAWTQREGLGAQPVGALGEYLAANSYPREIRGTLRDAVTYLWVELLVNQGTWRPEQQSGLDRLDVGALLADEVPLPALADPEVHPLIKVAALLSDLERWHAAADQPEAAFEARRVRLERLHDAITDADDRARIRASLAARAEAVRGQPWWSVGQHTLATMLQAMPTPDNLIQAREIAIAGRDAYPDSVGGQRCRHLVESIEAPAFDVDGMLHDGAARRSVGVHHKNLERLYFKAWRYDLRAYVERQKDYRLLPDHQFIQPLIDGKKPVASWTVDLPATPDFKSHRTWVVPPVEARGAYVIVASPDPGFRRMAAPMQATLLIVSDLVVVSRSAARQVEVRVVDGTTGAAVPGAELTLYRMDWRQGHARVGAKKTDAEGLATFTGDPGHQHFVLASRGADLSLEADSLRFGWDGGGDAQRAAFVYTDRSIYRPAQTVHWQIVAWAGSAKAAKFAVAPQSKVKVQLRDGNNQVVAEKDVTTNEFGSAAGEFPIPTGRALGQWRITCDLDTRGGALRVEEYKRPTFEAELEAPKAQARLNQPTRLSGSARYYFGLPVTAGVVKWRVVRTANYPWWWGWYWGGGGSAGTEVVGTGTTRLDDEGRFTIEFVPRADERLATGKGRAVTYNYAVSAEVTDEGGETRDASRTLRLGFVAVQATFELPANFLTAGVDAEVVIRRATLDGEPAAGPGTWALHPLVNPAETPTPADIPLPTEGQPHATPGDAQRPRWSTGYTPQMALNLLADGAAAQTGETVHGADGKGTLTLRAPAAGAYRLRYRTTDAFGADYEAEQLVIVGAARMPVGIAADLQVQASSVPVGQTARVLAYSGFAGQPLMITAWRDGARLWQRTLRAGQDDALLEIPITEADRGGIGLTLEFVRDHQFVRLERTVAVPWDDKQLAVSFKTFRDKLRPGQKETWTVSVKGPGAKQASAEVLAYMYDKSLDVFAPHSPPVPSSLYPWRANVPWQQSNLQAAQRVWVESGSFPGLSNFPTLNEDRLLFPSGYGVGGPGGGRMERRDGFGFAAGAPEPEAVAEMPARAQPVVVGSLMAKSAENKPMEAGEASSADEGGDSTRAQAAPEAPLRSNFSETAFFQPQLALGPEGQVDITFEVPDSVTAWNVWVHAIGKDLSSGSVHQETKTVKELMVRPYLPRFLREGDEATLEVVINNAGEAALTGAVDFDIIDPETEASLLAEFGLTKAQASGVAFSAKAGGSDRKSFPVKAPTRLGLVAFKVTAHAGDFSDGELRPIPVLPSRVHLAQSRFATLRGGVTKTLRFEALAKGGDPTRVDEQLVVTLDGQLFYGVLQALPYLVNYPYECTEQTLNRFVSTGILSTLYKDYPAVARMAKKLSERDTPLEAWDGDDPNRKLALEETPWLQAAKGGTAKNFEKVLDPRVARATREASLARLRKSQTSLGGFPWWSGGPPSPYMTLYLLHGFSKALEFGVDVPKDMTQRAWGYLKRHAIDDALANAMAHDCCWEFITTVNYVLSNYPDESYGGGVFSAADRKKMLDFSFSHWKAHSPYLKGYLALTLGRAGRKAEATLVWESVLDSAKEGEDQGTFWAPEDRSWLWYNDTIETHAFALRTTMELKPEWPKLEGLVLWLFVNKKLNHWKSTRATAEVIYSLAHYLKKTGQLGVREETDVTIGARQSTFVFEPDEFTGKKNQIVVPGAELTPADATITIAQKTKGFQMASATWHFSTEQMPAEAQGDFLGVTRTYYKRVKSGREVTLEPLADGAKIEVGDELEVQLSLRSKHALEYVHLRDPRGAGFEPTDLRSAHKWDLGIGWFEEIRDSATNFFFESLPVGEYTFKYRVRAATAGAFKVGPATVQPMYAPEFAAYSAGHVLTVSKP